MTPESAMSFDVDWLSRPTTSGGAQGGGGIEPFSHRKGGPKVLGTLEKRRARFLDAHRTYGATVHTEGDKVRHPPPPAKGAVYTEGEADERGNKRVVVEIRRLWRGQYFGELGTVTKTVRSASVVSMTQVDVLVMAKADVFRLGFDGGQVAERMAKVAAELGYVYDSADVRKLLVDQFKWKNYRQDMTADIVFGSNLAETAEIPHDLPK